MLLFSIDFKVKPGQLAAVVGHVGAGKSSLIQAILGEMQKVTGLVTLRVRKSSSKLFFVYFVLLL